MDTIRTCIDQLLLKLPRFKPSDNYLVSMESVVVRARHHGLDIAVLLTLYKMCP